jgi:hypothetical protein
MWYCYTCSFPTLSLSAPTVLQSSSYTCSSQCAWIPASSQHIIVIRSRSPSCCLLRDHDLQHALSQTAAASFAGSRPQLTVHRHTGQEPRRSSHGSMQGVWNTCPHACAAVTSPRKGSRHTGQSPAGPEELVSAPHTAGDDSVLATAGPGRAVATQLDSRPGTRSRSPMRARKRRRVPEMTRRRAT